MRYATQPDPRPDALPGDKLVVVEDPEWPDPHPLPDDLPAVPEFIDALLPAVFRPWVMDIAERMQCPPDYPAAGAIVALSAAVGRRASIRPKRRDDWTEVPNLWGAVIGRPGLMKSPALDEVLRPLKRLELEAAEVYREAMADHEAAKRVSKAMERDTDKRIRAAVKAGDDARALVRDMERELGGPPPRTRYIVPDATVEALAEILATNPYGVLIFRDELTGFLMGLEKEGREDARAFVLEGWNGTGGYASDRIGRGHVSVPHVCLSVLGGIQPGRVEPYVRQALRGGVGDDGLLQRFQVLVWPDVSVAWRNVDRWPDTRAKATAHDAFGRLAAMDPEGEPRRFDEAAQELFTEWHTGLERRLRSGELHPAMESHLAKYRKLMPSLALLLHLADGGADAIPLDAAERAAAWCKYLEAHARRLYATATHGPAITARLIAVRIKRGDLKDGFTARDVYRPQWSGLTDAERVTEALGVLAEHDWLAPETLQTGGAPKVRYRINPKVGGIVR